MRCLRVMLMGVAMAGAGPWHAAALQGRMPRDALVLLSDLAHPPADLAAAGVRATDGRLVGAVQSVVLAKDGSPARIAVAMLDDQDHLVSLDAGGLRYDAKGNEIHLPPKAD